MEGHAKSVFSLFVENKCFIVPIYQGLSAGRFE